MIATQVICVVNYLMCRIVHYLWKLVVQISQTVSRNQYLCGCLLDFCGLFRYFTYHIFGIGNLFIHGVISHGFAC